MLKRWLSIVSITFMLSACGSTGLYVAQDDQPRSEWGTVQFEYDTIAELEKPIEPTPKSFAMRYGDSVTSYLIADSIIDQETDKKIPDNSFVGVNVIDPEDRYDRVIIPLNAIKSWKKGTSTRGDWEAWWIEHDLPNLPSPVSTEWDPHLRYIDLDSGKQGKAKFSVGKYLIINSYSSNGIPETGYLRENPVFHFMSLEPGVRMKVSAANDAIDELERKISERKEEIRIREERKRIEKENRRRQREANFLARRELPRKIGSFVCSKDNVIGAVERVANDRLKISWVGRAARRTVDYRVSGPKYDYEERPEYWIFDEKNERFTIDDREEGRVIWVDMDEFVPCDISIEY